MGTPVALEGAGAALCVPQSRAVLPVRRRQPVLAHVVGGLEKRADVLAGAMKCSVKTRDFRCPARQCLSFLGVPQPVWLRWRLGCMTRVSTCF